MTRLFVTIVLVVFASIYLSEIVVNEVEMAMYSNDGNSFFADQYGGTFDLLDDAIAEYQQEELPAVVDSLRGRFKTSVQLENRQGLELPEEGLSILDSGGIYLYDLGSSSSIHRTSAHPGQVWTLSIAPSPTQRRIAFASGPLSLISEKLAAQDPSNLPQAMEELRRSYGVPLELTTIADLDLNDDDIRSLDKNQIIVKNPFVSGEIIFMQQNDSGLILQFGPIDYPTSFEHGGWFFLSIIITILLIGVLIWVWPLWRDLQRLRAASVEIGNGKLETRIRSRPTSLIRSVLDGFNLMASRTENMVESQRELTNAVSHELRTPLARMMFDLEMARDADNAQDQSRHFDNLDRNVGELNTLVDELLTYARQDLVKSPLEFETFNVVEMNDWLHGQVSRAQRSHESPCRITIDFDVDSASNDPVHISPNLLAHALSNALQNALRFAKGNVAVQLRKQKEDWVLSVEDDGIGIAEDSRERVFEPFSRLDESRQRGSGGFGLGLSIVRKIAQWHQGDACIAPCKALSGTRVEIRWPIAFEFST